MQPRLRGRRSRVRGPRRSARARSNWAEPGAGRSWRGGDREDSAARAVSPVARPIFGSSRAAGVESEMELAYAGLHQLCAPFAGSDRAACPARSTTRSTPRSDGATATRRTGSWSASRSWACSRRWRRRSPFCGSWTTLSGSTRPPSQTLAFVARRLEAESVAMVVAMRDRRTRGRLRRARRARRLRTRGARRAWPARDGPDRPARRARPRPPRGRDARQSAGAAGAPARADARGDGRRLRAPAASSLTSRIEESFRRRLAPLPPSTRSLLLIASAEPIGDPVPVWRAAAALGVEPRGAARSGRPRRVQRTSAFPPSPRPFRGLPRRVAGGPRAHAPRAGRRDGPGGRS